MRKALSAVSTALFVFVLLWLQPGFVQAANPVVHVSAKPAWLSTVKPYDKKPPARTVQNGYFYALIERQVNVEQHADYNHIIRDIVSGAGIQNGSQISVSFEPSFERVDFHEIIVWRNNKPINKLNASAFKVLADEQELSSFIYQGSYSALYILTDIRKGDRIEYSYTVTGSNPIFANKFMGNFYFQSHQPIAHQYTALIAADKRALNIKTFNAVPKAVITQAAGLKKYEWEAFMVAAGTYEDKQPAWYNSFPYVQVSEYSNWNEVAKWALSINPVITKFTGELADEVAQLKKQSGNSKEKYFRNAVKAVQDEVRYMGIEIGEYSHRANNPAKVFAQRYGDCKDKALLLTSLLRANGIDAWMVLVNTSMRGRVDQYLPTANAFNHAVVTAVVDGKQVWVDATIAYQRGSGTDIYFPPYGKGLILKDGTHALTTIPVKTGGKMELTETYNVMDAVTPATLTVYTAYTGSEADYMRDKLASSSMAETEKTYIDYYAKIYPKIESTDSVTVTDDEQENKIVTIESYKIPDFFKKDSVEGGYVRGFYANYISDQLSEINSRLKTPVSVNYPYNIDYSIKVNLPGGWSIDASHTDIERDAYRLNTSTSADGDMLTLNYKFSYLQDHIPVNKLDEYRKDVKKISDDELAYTFTYNPGNETKPLNLKPMRVNMYMVLCITLLGIVIAVGGVLIYRRETPGIVFSFGSGFEPLGGWLILILVVFFFITIAGFFSLFSEGYFDLDKWNKYGTAALSNQNKTLITIKAIGHIILTGYSIFCLILFLNRRDILPKYIIGFFISVVVVNAVTYIVSSSTLPDKNVYNDLIFSIVMGAICIPYFIKSHRVKYTFIVPQPANNYSYEMRGADAFPANKEQQ
ncbi:DUF3857 domain-containing protein [Mucilaginibacter gynuensis]|uniref:DUF3857 domain-containing protein n=1 Tax=Mucilaginibacter gynuensis TaxID=1302236 RepID=A0ABP8G369_9SPHI